MSQCYRIELNIGSLCNFKCRYCFENGDDCNYTPTTISWEYLQNLVVYIKKLKRKYPKKYFYLIVYGGEPLLQLDTLIRFIGKVHTDLNCINIVTNSHLVDKYKDQILKLKNFKCFINFVVSYDFTNQDTMRHKGSYQVVRDNIKWLYSNNFVRKIITVFSNKNITTMSDVYLDFVKLRKELPKIRLFFNIDRFNTIPMDIDEESIRSSLSIIKDHMDANPEFKGSMMYNNNLGRRRLSDSLDNCFYGNIHIAMAYDGSLYPGYEVIYENNYIKNLLYIGNITESFETIEEKRQLLINKISTQPKKECQECFVPCRVCPWRVIKTSLDECMDIPNGGHCKLHKLIGEYLD